MNREEIIRLAYEAGLHSAVLLHEFHGKESALCRSEIEELRRIERFAALVAGAENEACAALCDGKARHWRELSNVPLLGYIAELEDCAAAIRARKTHE